MLGSITTVTAFAHPGTWAPFIPVFWAIAAIVFFRLTARSARASLPERHRRLDVPAARERAREGAIEVLQRRFASGEIDDDEYWQRRSTIDADR
jgi:putative membrane protein